MATFEAIIKTVPHGSDFKVTTEAGSITTAKQQIVKLYDPIYIHNLREVGSGFTFTGGDLGGMLMLGAVLFVIWLFVEYFWIMTPLTVIILIACIYKKFSE